MEWIENRKYEKIQTKTVGISFMCGCKCVSVCGCVRMRVCVIVTYGCALALAEMNSSVH